MSDAERIKAWALEVGFDRAGVARVERPAHAPAFLSWLGRGEQAGMEWMARRVELRLDPRLLLDGCARSAVCVALHYAPLAADAPAAGDLWPRVARYARGADYHRLMEGRLDSLARRVLEAFPGCRSRRWVDTGPILERELSAAAGLGAVGKNTCLLHPEAGSWFLIGELLVDMDLAADPPLADPCGSCSRCLAACPTGALPEPYRLDSNRCISYWTIEHRGWLPPESRRMVGDWVFGCDICQEVCPWNDAPLAVDHPELRLPDERAELDLAALLALDEPAYHARFRATALKRARLEGLQRNAAVAMGNRGDEAYVPGLDRALAEAAPVVRGHAAWALGRIGGTAARAALERAATREQDPRVREEIAAALGD